MYGYISNPSNHNSEGDLQLKKVASVPVRVSARCLKNAQGSDKPKSFMLIGEVTMKKMFRVATYVVASCILGFTGLANAKMEITAVDLSGQPLPPGAPAATCLGDDAYVDSGQLKIMLKQHEDPSGGFHVTYHEQLINMLVFDPSSNTFYRAAGTSLLLNNFSSFQMTSGGTVTVHASVNNVFIPIGNSDAPDHTLHVLFQLTTNSNGETTAEVEGFRTTCE